MNERATIEAANRDPHVAEDRNEGGDCTDDYRVMWVEDNVGDRCNGHSPGQSGGLNVEHVETPQLIAHRTEHEGDKCARAHRQVRVHDCSVAGVFRHLSRSIEGRKEDPQEQSADHREQLRVLQIPVLRVQLDDRPPLVHFGDGQPEVGAEAVDDERAAAVVDLKSREWRGRRMKKSVRVER